MNGRSFYVMSLSFLCLFCSHMINARMIEFASNPNFTQAPQEITKKIEAVVAQLNFEKPYQVICPTEIYLISEMHNNPFMGIGQSIEDEITGNIVLILNPNFFNELTDSQQSFFISWLLLMHEDRDTLWLVVTLLAQLLMLLVLVFLMRWTLLKNYKIWLSIIAAVLILIISNNTFLKPIYTYVQNQNDFKIVHAVLSKKICDYVDARDVFLHIKKTIKKRYEDGHFYWKPYKNMFDHIITDLNERNRLVEVLMSCSSQYAKSIRS